VAFFISHDPGGAKKVHVVHGHSKFFSFSASFIERQSRSLPNVCNLSDSDILRRIKGGETAAFGELYQKYHRRLFGYCYRLLRDRDAAEDIVQTVFLKALESVKSLEKPELFSYWLFSIARNEVYGIFRATRNSGTVRLDEDVWDGETPHERLVQTETNKLVEDALNRLKPEYREVLVLRQFEKLSYAEIAAITGSTMSSVESRLFKARKALIKYLEPYMRERDLS
jgi:RNA polymerase sigma-70 factor (ECF subfamily)